MRNSLFYLSALVVLLILLGSACLFTPQATLQAQNDATIAAMAAGTLDAVATHEAVNASPTAEPVSNPTQLSPTPLPPAATLVSTSTPFPTFTPQPTFTPLPTLTPIPLATATSPIIPTGSSGSSGGGSGSASGGSSGGGGVSRCNWAEFVSDVTIPDNTEMTKDQIFNKVWRVRNIGTCTWNTKYTVIFSSGDKMDGAASSVPEQVSPGEEVDLTVTMKSPEKTGTYDGNWILKSEKGTKFGIGANADQPLTVSIEIIKGSGSIYYDFGANYCAATWSTKDNDQLPCPGKENDSEGFVILLSEPALENRNENEPALWTQPPDADGAYIMGEYPKIKVSSGDRFLADVGCLMDQKKCDVIFRLRYQIGDDDPVDLGHWNETYDGDITRIDVDLSALDGESVKFILMVKVNDNPQDAAGFWLVPRLIR